jgi:hypothetical protein
MSRSEIASDTAYERLRTSRLAAKVRRNVDLMPLTTYRVGGPARMLIEPAAAAAPARASTGLARFGVAALVLFTTMASFAAVATVTGVLPKLLEAISSPEPVAPSAPATRREARAEEAQPAPLEPEPAAEAAPSPPPPPVAAPAPAAALSRVVARAEAPALPPPPLAEVPDAGSLFARANQARVRGDRPDAVRLYGELLEQFPGGEEARVAQATLGRLLLDSGDPQAALVQLDAYLAGGDATLREEVLAARATALSRLNRPRDEAAAWNALLESYPDSVHGTRARSRLADLELR